MLSIFSLCVYQFEIGAIFFPTKYTVSFLHEVIAGIPVMYYSLLFPKDNCFLWILFGQDGRTPLLMAIQGAFEDVVKLLLERGAKVNIADNAKK